MTREGYLKHEAIIKEWARGAVVEYYCKGKQKWEQIDNPTWYISTEYRIKPSLKYIPFTFETIQPHKDKWINKISIPKSLEKITVISDCCIKTYTFLIPYHDLLKEYVFEDGTPCGTLVNE